MSLVLKSNIIATASIGNLSGINGTQDWIYFADFDNEQVKKQANDNIEYISAADLLDNTGSLSMAAKPVTYTKSGIESYIPNAQTLRFSHAGNGQYGLLVESVARANIFVNSAAPANQTINATATAQIIASVKGSGSLTLNSPNFSAPVVVTENAPKLITPINATIASVITATTSGALTHAQVERIGNSFPIVSSKITNIASPAQLRGLDKIALVENVLSDIKTSPFILLMKVVPPHLLANTILASQVPTILAAETATKSNLTVLNTGMNLDATVRMSQYTPESNAVNGNSLTLSESGFTIAAQYEGTTITTSVNGGNPVTAQLSESIGNLTSIVLASLSNYGPATGGIFIIPKFVVYKKSMTSNELKQLSSSWVN